MLEPSVLKGYLREVTTRSPSPGGWRIRGLVVLLLLPAGCAAAPPPASEAAPRAPVSGAPEPSPQPRPTTLNLTELDALEHDLSVSEARLADELARQTAPPPRF